MSQPYTFQAANNRTPTPLRIGQIFFTILALLAFAVGSLLLSLIWFGVGVTATGSLIGEARGSAFILLWPVTMLVAWICSALALLLAKRWLLALLSLPAAVAILLGVWALVTFFLLNASAVIFTAFFIVLNVAVIGLSIWSLRSTSR